MPAFLLLVLICSAAHSATAAVDPLFESDAPLILKLVAPMRQITRDRSSDPDDRPGTLGYESSEGKEILLDVGVRPRGKSRRNKEVCRFPPLRLNFKKKQVADTLFAHQDKLKLVTHCRRSSSFEQYLLVEYLAYKTLNLLTDVSFKVRLVTIEYTDGDKNLGTYSGFLIEHKNRLAERIGHQLKEPVSIKTRELEPQHTSLVELYQLMIGNTDFSFLKGPKGDVCCHNAVLFESGEKYLAIPYDFDVTGLVNPPHAPPNEDLGLRSVTRRLFRGFCRSEEFSSNALHLFKTRKQDIYELFSERPFNASQALTKRTSSRTRKYLDGFYAIIEDPRKLDQKISSVCR